GPGGVGPTGDEHAPRGRSARRQRFVQRLGACGTRPRDAHVRPPGRPRYGRQLSPPLGVAAPRRRRLPKAPPALERPVPGPPTSRRRAADPQGGGRVAGADLVKVDESVQLPQARVPFARTQISEEAREAVARVLSSGWVTTGPEVGEFERDFAEFVAAPEAVAVASCTAA